jgi:hypothetical protein
MGNNAGKRAPDLSRCEGHKVIFSIAIIWKGRLWNEDVSVGPGVRAILPNMFL